MYDFSDWKPSINCWEITQNIRQNNKAQRLYFSVCEDLEIEKCDIKGEAESNCYTDPGSLGELYRFEGENIVQRLIGNKLGKTI